MDKGPSPEPTGGRQTGGRRRVRKIWPWEKPDTTVQDEGPSRVDWVPPEVTGQLLEQGKLTGRVRY